MKIVKVLLPILLLAAGALAARVMILSRPPVEKQPLEILPPLVRAVEARAQELQLSVHAYGTVQPRTQSNLVAQVAGRVTSISPAFQKGGFFEAGEVLVQIDPIDYELAVAQAEARVAQARVQVTREEAESALAREEWRRFGQGAPDPLALREPQLAEARAALAAAEATLQQARLNLERTRIKAPYAGRVWDKTVDVSQYVVPGTSLARVYAIDAAEVRLPLPLDELQYVDLPGPAVVLRARIGADEQTWNGTIVRTEAEVDARTRMIHAVAQVPDPYAQRPPLMVGLFVEARILGRTTRAFVLPRAALRGDDRVLVVRPDDALVHRTVKIFRQERDRVLVSSGLDEGERVCVSTLDIATDGMKVRVQVEAQP